ncbi:unnamed protein product [Pleuronectes platessa]|uniref:Uncharacterized protein n=1 Tax=Pleuronectes platessa TaxID=8262 RepID=A0A9N7YZR0_PLEPL|nr:unnamed protein product [Pleuronectes platessa]
MEEELKASSKRKLPSFFPLCASLRLWDTFIPTNSPCPPGNVPQWTAVTPGRKEIWCWLRFEKSQNCHQAAPSWRAKSMNWSRLVSAQNNIPGSVSKMADEWRVQPSRTLAQVAESTSQVPDQMGYVQRVLGLTQGLLEQDLLVNLYPKTAQDAS